jgi:caffeoyl-CoA O-methyltransferase
VSRSSSFLDSEIQQYIVATTVREPDVLAALRAETAPMPNGGMQIGADQGQWMQVLARIIGVRRYLEVGVFTGYSSLAMALAMPPDGKIVACDVSAEYTSVARRYWERAGVASKIDLRLGPALDTLEALIAQRTEPFDCAFIDADKPNADGYYERCLQLLRAGGVLLFDNVLWSGAVVDESDQSESTRALRAINLKAGRDERVDVSLLPVGDGLLVVRKR